MTSSIRISPPNGLVWIADTLRAEELPAFPTESRIASTKSCIALGCVGNVDGDTSFTVGPEREVNPGGRPIFDAVIDTPDRKVAIWTLEPTPLLKEKVAATRTRIRIWGNRPRFPDQVVIGLAEADS